MERTSLAAWQWSDYHQLHRNRVNLGIHLGAVPAFLLGNVIAAIGLVTVILAVVPSLAYNLLAGISAVAIGLVLSALAMALQGIGHKREARPPKPFRGPGDALARIFVEQWFTFPRFVLTGGWGRAWRQAEGRSNRT